MSNAMEVDGGAAGPSDGTLSTPTSPVDDEKGSSPFPRCISLSLDTITPWYMNMSLSWGICLASPVAPLVSLPAAVIPSYPCTFDVPTLIPYTSYSLTRSLAPLPAVTFHVRP
eukprot:TRINITY_DN2180_c0_g1_i3.p1 TRINITY_DN2180_c0_g1~~TRINITY_DN2180_c0_g1_i3.p1  ORF type:complete len:113 (+),score=2.68 TRINITY_DN2180_c0_g1_i3:390-728(+)